MILETPHGPAQVHLHLVEGASTVLVLGHGAGGGVGAPDLKAATETANGEGVSVVLVEQPYRVAGRKSPAPAPQLDAAWTAVCAQLPIEPAHAAARRRALERARAWPAGRPRRSARRACSVSRSRCTRPGGRRRRGWPSSRRSKVPVLIVQGESDPFGMPPEAPQRTVVKLRGNHSLRVRRERAARRRSARF